MVMTINFEYRAEIKNMARQVNMADKNIRAAMIAARNKAVQDITEFLDSESTWSYPGEHMAGKTGRERGSQVSDIRGSGHFKFFKPTQVLGSSPIFGLQLYANPEDPQPVGEVLLSGSAPHHILSGNIEGSALVFPRYEGVYSSVVHPGTPSYGSWISQNMEAIFYNAVISTEAELGALGDALFVDGAIAGLFLSRYKKNNAEFSGSDTLTDSEDHRNTGLEVKGEYI